VFPTSPADLGRFMAAETEKYAKVVKFAGIISRLAASFAATRRAWP
jgi:hypothetical protein